MDLQFDEDTKAALARGEVTRTGGYGSVVEALERVRAGFADGFVSGGPPVSGEGEFTTGNAFTTLVFMDRALGERIRALTLAHYAPKPEGGGL